MQFNSITALIRRHMLAIRYGTHSLSVTIDLITFMVIGGNSSESLCFILVQFITIPCVLISSNNHFGNQIERKPYAKQHMRCWHIVETWRA